MVEFWLARDQAHLEPPVGDDPYVLCNADALPEREELAGCVFWRPQPELGHLLNAALWHRCGGMRLPPGAPPVLVRIAIRCEVIGGDT